MTHALFARYCALIALCALFAPLSRLICALIALCALFAPLLRPYYALITPYLRLICALLRLICALFAHHSRPIRAPIRPITLCALFAHHSRTIRAPIRPLLRLDNAISGWNRFCLLFCFMFIGLWLLKLKNWNNFLHLNNRQNYYSI